MTKYEGGGQARYEILPDEARVIRQVFDWVGHHRLTIGEVCRRLTQTGEVTRTTEVGPELGLVTCGWRIRNQHGATVVRAAVEILWRRAAAELAGRR